MDGVLDQAAAAAQGAQQQPAQPQPEQPPVDPAAAGAGAQPMAGGPVPFDEVQEEPATPEEQQEYESAMEALATVLYKNDQTNAAVMKGLVPEEKIDSVVKTSLLVVTQLDQKINMDDVIVPEITQETVERVIDLMEQAHGVEFSETEAQQSLAAVWEGVMQLMGGDDPIDEEIVQDVDQQTMDRYGQQLQGLLNG